MRKRASSISRSSNIFLLYISSHYPSTVSRKMTSLFRYTRRLKPPENFHPAAYFTTTPPPRTASPPPIEVRLTETDGRGVFATRRITAGELIHTAKPVVCHPVQSSINKVCYFCLKSLAFGSYSRPGEVGFCSQFCREQAMGFFEIEKGVDWSTFDDYCRTQGLKYPLLAKRLACMVISGVASEHSLDILQPAPLPSEVVSQMEEEFGLLRSSLKDSNMKGEHYTFLTKEWYTGVLARIRINAFRVELAGGSIGDLLASASASIEAEGAVGNAVYMIPSFYNHDCDPNSHIVWIENVDARLKSLRDIEPGEELRICYIDASLDCKVRQTILSRGFGFHCHCARCVSND